MADIRLFYGSTSGNTESVAELIAAEMGIVVSSVTSIADASPEDLGSAEALILGVSTHGDGELQYDWEDFFPHMDEIDLSGKKVALFGLGDAVTYPDQFVNALGMLYQKVTECGAEVVGFWPTGDYDFDESSAVEYNKFVGLVIDEDSEPDKTEDRVRRWVEMIKPELAE